MLKLLKYEFKRSYKTILVMCSVIILLNLILLARPISNTNILEYFLFIIILSIFTLYIFYEIGIFKKDFIDNYPNIIQTVPQPANVIFGSKVLKSMLCFSIFYTVFIIFSLINGKGYSENMIIFFYMYDFVPMMIIAFLNLMFFLLDMLLIGFLALLAAARITHDKKKTFTLAFISGVIILVLILFLTISVKIPFVYSASAYETSVLAIIFVLLFGTICNLLENKTFFTLKSIGQFIIPVILITLLSFLTQYVFYSQRVIENPTSTFVDDPSLIGKWIDLGKIDSINNFDPNITIYIEKYPELPSIVFMSSGDTDKKYIKWTKNAWINLKLSTENNCTIKEIYGDRYMFVEWKDEYYIYEHAKPRYLVLKKINDKK